MALQGQNWPPWGTLTEKEAIDIQMYMPIQFRKKIAKGSSGSFIFLQTSVCMNEYSLHCIYLLITAK